MGVEAICCYAMYEALCGLKKSLGNKTPHNQHL